MSAHPPGAAGHHPAASPAVAHAHLHGRPAAARPAPAHALIDLVRRRRFAGTPEFEHAIRAAGPEQPGETAADFLFLAGDDPHTPDDVFDRLRWGGQVIYLHRKRPAVEAAARAFAEWRLDDQGPAAARRGAWVLEQPPAVENKYLFNLRLLGWRTPVHFTVARKVMLVPPGRSSDRFTYNVYLEKNPSTGEYEVVKEVPTAERVLARLREKFPDADQDTLKRRARKFTDKIFPVFLTRETAILKLLQRDLPKKFRNRVPRVLAADVDGQGYTRTLRLNWLRNAQVPLSAHHLPAHGHNGHAARAAGGAGGGRPLTQLEFACQSAELLASLHDDAKVMHLDLRLDNVVITEHGVGFVDFGSAVRVGEEFPEASLLSNLFDEMMRTSQIQRMLGKMAEAGQVTSEEICNSYHRIDKAVDFFYLAVQINAPHSNPDFRGLVEFDPGSEEAKALAQLTEEILRPADKARAKFTSAQDILKGIEEIDRRLRRRR
jgi:hypothetical protein